MPKWGLPILLAVAISILLQNTCPHGWAERTGFAASAHAACPHKMACHQTAGQPSGFSTLARGFNSLNPIYTIHICSREPRGRDLEVSCQIVLARQEPFEDFHIGPPHRPPLAAPLA